MASKKIGTVGSNVTVLGLTVKENCHDLRNARVPDVISELEKFRCEVQVHVPLCNPEEALEEYGISLCDEYNLLPAHAIVSSVSHRIYTEWTTDRWKSLLVPQGIVFDLKNIVPSRSLQSMGYLVCIL